MAKKKQEEDQAEKELLPVELTVTSEHVASPHGIELRRNGSPLVIDVRTQDFRSTEVIGAKTIENLLREAGADLPTGDKQLVIKFSPHNGEIISVEAKTEEPSTAPGAAPAGDGEGNATANEETSTETPE